MNEITFSAIGFSDYIYWQMQDRKTLNRINNLLEDIQRNGVLKGIGKPEKLKSDPGYSRRIDAQNRLIYEIDELSNIRILSCRGHYND